MFGGEFSGSLKPFSLISSENIMTIRVPPMNGIRSHAFTFNITSTDQLGLLTYIVVCNWSLFTDSVGTGRQIRQLLRKVWLVTVNHMRYYYTNEPLTIGFLKDPLSLISGFEIIKSRCQC